MFWNTFYNLCEKNNTKPNAVAKIIGVSSATCTKWKNGAIPNGETLLKLANYLEVSTDYLLGRTNTPQGINNSGASINQQYVDGNATANITSGKEKPMTNDTTIIQLIEAFQKLDFKNKTKVMSLIAELSE